MADVEIREPSLDAARLPGSATLTRVDTPGGTDSGLAGTVGCSQVAVSSRFDGMVAAPTSHHAVYVSHP